MKIAYIAHPISGDVEGNTRKILAIVKRINLEEPDTVPFAAYLADIFSMDDSIPEERERGIRNDTAVLKAGFITELRLYGDSISNGMRNEVLLAREMGIPLVAMTEGTARELRELETAKPQNRKI